MLLRQAGVKQRSRNTMQAGRILPRTIIALIVQVNAVCNGAKSALVTISFHRREELILAVEAASVIVAPILDAIQFRRMNDLQRNSLLFGKSYGVTHLPTRKTGRIGEYGLHTVAQFLMCRPREKPGIDSTGIGNKQPPQRTQMSIQTKNLCGKLVC